MNDRLPYDVSRCHGFKDNPLCIVCLRRQAGNPIRQSYIIMREEPKTECSSQIIKKVVL